MKKSIVLAVLGGALAAATSSYGQGQIYFSSYLATPFGSQTTLLGGGAVPDGFTAQLYFALGTVSVPVTPDNILSPITGLTAIGNLVTYDTGAASGGLYPGYFTGAVLSIPGYTGGPISFEILATGLLGGVEYMGRSGSWTMQDINVGASSPGSIMTGMPSWQVAPVPEPTTLALAGLGGLASLVAFRRKQA